MRRPVVRAGACARPVPFGATGGKRVRSPLGDLTLASARRASCRGLGRPAAELVWANAAENPPGDVYCQAPRRALRWRGFPCPRRSPLCLSARHTIENSRGLRPARETTRAKRPAPSPSKPRSGRIPGRLKVPYSLAWGHPGDAGPARDGGCGARAPNVSPADSTFCREVPSNPAVSNQAALPCRGDRVGLPWRAGGEY